MKPGDAEGTTADAQSARDASTGDVAETVSLPHNTSSGAYAGTAGAETDWIGKTLGNYRVTGVLGRGAMGVVLKALDPMIEREVAIKILAQHLASDATARERFLAEARAAGKINHPNVTSIYEIFRQGELIFLVLERVPGGSLQDRLTEGGPLPVAEATRALVDACVGVGAAHAAGLIHRDIKPSNFMRAADGSIKVADFGLAKASGASGLGLTQSGAVVGTPLYMSPEQCEGRPLDQRSDIYSLGATYYALLTGKSPYTDSESVPQLMYAHCHAPIPDPRAIDAKLPEACARIIALAMAKAPEQRYQSTAEMASDLRALLAAQPGQAAVDLPSSSGTSRTATYNTAPSVRRRSRSTLVLALGTVVIVGLIIGGLVWGRKPGSGGDANAAAPSSPPLTATAPGVTPTEIVLGMSAPFSGPAKELGRGMQTGIETYLRHVNETASGIHGRKLRLLALDDGYEPNRSATATREMIDKRPVFAFAGNVGTAPAEAALPIALENKRVFFGAFTGAGLLRREPPDRYVFNYRASYAEETAEIVQYLLTVRRVKPEEIAVFAQRDGYGDAGFSGVAKALRRAGFDADKIVRVGYERNSMDLDAAVNGLLQHRDKIKAVVMVPTYRQAAAFIKRVVDGGMKPIFTSVSFVNSDALAEALKEMGAKYADGVIVTQVVPFYGSGATAVIEYRERLAHFFPAEQPGFVSLEGYVAARLLCEGLERAGPELTADKLVAALETIRDFDFGIGTPLTFGLSEHQASHKVWAAVLDGQGHFRSLDLD